VPLRTHNEGSAADPNHVIVRVRLDVRIYR
jgi:hypothetical protein